MRGVTWRAAVSVTSVRWAIWSPASYFIYALLNCGCGAVYVGGMFHRVVVTGQQQVDAVQHTGTCTSSSSAWRHVRCSAHAGMAQLCKEFERATLRHELGVQHPNLFR